MTIADQIAQNLVEPEKHAPILKALLSILEEKGEKALKDQIVLWIKEVQEELPEETKSEV